MASLPRPSLRTVKRLIGLAVLIVAAIFFFNSNSSYLIVFGKTPSYPHYVQLTVPSAFEATKGERVTEGGLGVGEITTARVTNKGKAHLVLGLSDSAWPLPTDSKLYLRMGGTIKFTDRYVQIDPGNAHTDFADDALIPSRQFIVPVEYDTVFNIFNAKTRSGLKQLMDNGGPAFEAAAASFNRALGDSAPALGQVNAVFSDLAYNQQALSTLVSSTATLSDAVAGSNPGLRTLISSAASTFSTVASRSRDLGELVDEASPAFKVAGETAYHVKRTLTRVATLSSKLEPGLTQLHDIAPSLNATLERVVSVTPSATAALDTVKQHGGQIQDLLDTARTKLMPQLTTVTEQTAVGLQCIRPYTPDFVSWAQGWAGFFSAGLNTPNIHVVKARITFLPFTNTMPIDAEQMHELFPNLSVNFPEVPGSSWNQPWYQPQCGLTAADDNPADDSEAHVFDPDDSKSIAYGPTTTPVFTPNDPSLFGDPKAPGA